MPGAARSRCAEQRGVALADTQTTKLFYSLVWPQRAAVLRLAQILTGNMTEAEDLAQETLIKAFKAIGGLREGSDVKAWLMTILRNTRIDRLRAGALSAGNVSLEQVELDPPGDLAVMQQWQNPQEVLDGFSDQQVIEALQQLPDAIRWTLLLADVEGWDHKDAAALLDVPVGTIKSRVHRGRAMLREALLPVARQMRLVRDTTGTAEP